MSKKKKKKKKSIKKFADLETIMDKKKLKNTNTPQHDPSQHPQRQRLTCDEYDSLLNSEQELSHNPNPFDFVFFQQSPQTYTTEEFGNYGPLTSGYIEVRLKALTPVHIVGRQDPVRNMAGKKIWKSHFYMQDGLPCIPGSSIRGMLRTFIEAVTNGWVSQANEEYPQQDKIRHIKFKSWKSEPHNHRCLNSPSGLRYTASPAIPPAFKPSPSDERMDIATYLFGYVNEENSSARASRVIIEDAYVNSGDLRDYRMVDVEAEAIMGGPRPRANWWYMRPREVWDRSVQGGRRQVAHIVGDQFWGRKFYYHQDPERCIGWYSTGGNWPLARGVRMYDYPIECLDRERTASFRIYFKHVPERLLKLLCTCLCMPSTSKMRHKLGYGKAFGYGSVEFEITSAMLRTEKQADFPDPLRPVSPVGLVKRWTDDEVKDFIDEPSLRQLARILTYAPEDDIIFTYPPYSAQNFQQVIQARVFNRNVKSLSLGSPTNPLNEHTALTVARELWDIKHPVHFLLYQARAKGYNRIRMRTPQQET